MGEPLVGELASLVERLRESALRENPASAVKAVLQNALHDPVQFRQSIPAFEENDVILFEDECVSIWHCRFEPGHTVPPHDHQMTAVIGVYSGVERNVFFEHDASSGLTQVGEREVQAGQVLQIASKAIHSVACPSEEPCLGIHVYLGCLTEVDRSLFDTKNGEAMRFTDENYYRLVSKS